MVSSKEINSAIIETDDNLLFRPFAGAAAFIKKDMKTALSYKLQFVFQFVQMFFSIAVIYFIGKMLSQTGKGFFDKYNADYFSFALIGLAINSYLRVGLVTITNDIRQIMNQGTLEAMCAAPVNYTWLMFCCSLWQFLFETIKVVSFFIIASVIFGMRLRNINYLSMLAVWMLTVPIFFLLGIISCSILVVVKKGDPVNWIFSSLGAILAGTMFPVDVLPGWAQAVSDYFPLTHSLEAMRRAMLLGAGFAEIKNSLLALAVFLVILVPLTLFANNICMSLAKKRGAFSTY